jgi:hypothetical protein
MMFRQGFHYKTSSIIIDEHVQALFMAVKDEHRTPEKFKTLRNETFITFRMPPPASVFRHQKDGLRILDTQQIFSRKGIIQTDTIVMTLLIIEIMHFYHGCYNMRDACKSILVRIRRL